MDKIKQIAEQLLNQPNASAEDKAIAVRFLNLKHRTVGKIEEIKKRYKNVKFFGTKKCLIGFRSGRLVAVAISGRAKDRQLIYKCECDCGGTHNVKARYLREKRTKSCGCITRGRPVMFKPHMYLKTHVPKI